MTSPATTPQQIDTVQEQRFLSAIKPWSHLYSHSWLSFLALKEDGALSLMDARLFLSPGWDREAKPKGIFETERLIVGQVAFNDLGLSTAEFLGAIRAGKVKVGKYQLDFSLDEGQRVTTYFIEFDQDSASNSRRVATLSMVGMRRSNSINKHALDWHLRAHAYDSLDELCVEYGVGAVQLSAANVDVKAFTVVEALVNAEVKGDSASPALIAANETERSKLGLAYRVYRSEKVEARGSLSGDELTWEAQGSNWIGSMKLGVKPGSVIHCFASYDGIVQHHAWIGDPSASPNLRHTIFKELDPELLVIRDYLFEEKKPRKEAREFELAVGWILWMRGFSVLHVAAKRLEDNVDLVAITPANKILLIECTLGMLSKEGKTSSLLQRTSAMKKHLNQSGMGNILVLPIGVTAKPKDELANDIAEAGKAGVVLLTKDDLEVGLRQSFAPTNADTYWDQLNQDAKKRLGPETSMPF